MPDDKDAQKDKTPHCIDLDDPPGQRNWLTQYREQKMKETLDRVRTDGRVRRREAIERERASKPVRPPR